MTYGHGLGGLVPAGGAASGAEPPDPQDELLGCERRPSGNVRERPRQHRIRNLLNGATSPANQVVVRVVGAGQLVVEGALNQLDSSQDSAPLKQGERAVNRGPGKPPPLPLQAKPERLGVKVAWRFEYRLHDHLAGSGGPELVRGEEIGPAPQRAGRLTRIGCG